MANNKIPIGFLSDYISQELMNYTTDVSDSVKKAVDDVSKEMFNNIKRDAPEQDGDYKGAMRLKTSFNGLYEKRKTFYVDQKSGEYRLTHLLENGHIARSGRRTKAYPHIKKNEEAAKAEFQKRVEEDIKNGKR